MATSKKAKTHPVSGAISPRDREVRLRSVPDNNIGKTPAWHIGIVDIGCDWSCAENWLANLCDSILPKLKDYETMTWQEIMSASGGRSRGTNNHYIEIEDLSKEAQKRLCDLKMDDIDALFCLRLSGKERIWGIVDGRIFKIGSVPGSGGREAAGRCTMVRRLRRGSRRRAGTPGNHRPAPDHTSRGYSGNDQANCCVCPGQPGGVCADHRLGCSMGGKALETLRIKR